MKRNWIVGLVVGTFALMTSLTTADDDNQKKDEGALASQLQEAAAEITEQTYRLRYKFETGETVRWKVVHLATTDTTVQGHTQTSKSRSLSTKVWKVSKVDADGNATLEHMVSDVDMWQKVSERPEVKYNSKTDQTPPPAYAQAAKTVGVPLAKLTLTPMGQVKNRDRAASKFSLGLGQITVPFPEKDLSAGDHWYVPRDVTVRFADGRVKTIKTRRKYKLEKVQAGLATISVQTQVITPVNDPRIEAQLMQELVAGTLKFDVDAGRMVSREIDWDETVVRFSGDNSMMKYRARYTESLLSPRTASRSQTSKK